MPWENGLYKPTLGQQRPERAGFRSRPLDAWGALGGSACMPAHRKAPISHRGSPSDHRRRDAWRAESNIVFALG